MFERILVPLDGSLFAEAALEPAFAVAEQFGAEVVLLRAVPLEELEYSVGLYALSGSLERQERQAALAYLHHVRATRKGCGLVIRLAVALGPAPSAIIAAAKRRAVSLIVMSTHGRSGLRRLFYGSVAEAVLRVAEMPVMVVPVRAPALLPALSRYQSTLTRQS
jgi:nucleotide-binding universal stress UspA family protein